MANIKIGPEFFQKEFSDYADRHWAFVREILQNSIDCGSDQINVTVQTVDGKTQVTVENDGEPMTEDILVNKLLALGASGKDFKGSAGGFGKAKIVLMLAHPSYEVRSGTMLLQGSGGEYTLEIDHPHFAGTRSIVNWATDCTWTINQKFERFAALCQWSGTLKLNGQVLDTDFRKGYHRRDFEWAKIFTNQQYKGLLVVRINGQPMFTRSTNWKGCVVVELTGNSGERLVASRDRLTYSCQNELDDFVTDLTVDTKSALRQQIADYKRYRGDKIRADKKKPQAMEGLNVAAMVASVAPAPQAQQLAGQTAPHHYGGIHSVAASRTANRTVSLGPEFIIKNTVGIDTPTYYLPGDDFSKYSKGLVKAWACTMKRLYELMGMEGEFSIGFVLDSESQAECEQSSEYGLVYYLNPATVAQNQRFNSRSFKARFSSAWAARFEIISTAVHEFIHGAYDLSGHDEEFSSKFGEIMAVVMANLKEFIPYYR